METTHSSEMSVEFKRSIRRYIPEGVMSCGVLCALNGTPLIWNTDYSPVTAVPARPDI
jgi:hypothetical protein